MQDTYSPLHQSNNDQSNKSNNFIVTFALLLWWVCSKLEIYCYFALLLWWVCSFAPQARKIRHFCTESNNFVVTFALLLWWVCSNRKFIVTLPCYFGGYVQIFYCYFDHCYFGGGGVWEIFAPSVC